MQQHIVRATGSPLNDRAGPGEAGAEGNEENPVALPDAPQAVCLVEGDGDGGCGGIAVFVEIDKHIFAVEIEPLDNGIDDAQVRLVRYDQIDVFDRETGGLNPLDTCFAHGIYSMLEDLAALHCEGGSLIGSGTRCHRARRPAAGNVQ